MREDTFERGGEGERTQLSQDENIPKNPMPRAPQRNNRHHALKRGRGPSAPARVPAAAAPAENAQHDAPPATAQTDPPQTDPAAAGGRGRAGLSSAFFSELFPPQLLSSLLPTSTDQGTATPAPRIRVRKRPQSAAGATPPRGRPRAPAGT